MPYDVGMENTTPTIDQIAQYVSERLASEPMFQRFVASELKYLIKVYPQVQWTDLLDQAVQNAYEVWQSYQEDLVYGY